MAVDICSESSSPIDSPRLSFSDDLTEPDLPHYARSDALLPNSTVDFNFCLGQGLSQEISPADELFANGRILPVEIKQITPRIKTHQPDPILGHSEARKAATKAQENVESANDNMMKKRLIEFLSYSSDADEEDKPLPRPFWQFRRSSSLNCDTGRTTNGLLRSLQFLTRSSSTGSAPNQKPKVIQKQQSSNSKGRSSDQYCPYNNKWKKPSLRKSNSRLHGIMELELAQF
ncbi:hypothetical protein Salat_1323700 [Sesamum alatum]|uniref:Uncharacterized protein n=1 Tax=Sesamum alatum TaxID=300844 RepID=A0AAE1YHB8_9LAMI|nr:hypothetical protein Salat_1323700 [Sesamum alatum]